jgi:hypothetical protein
MCVTLQETLPCADDNSIYGEAFFCIEVLLPQVSIVNLNKEGVEN